MSAKLCLPLWRSDGISTRLEEANQPPLLEQIFLSRSDLQGLSRSKMEFRSYKPSESAAIQTLFGTVFTNSEGESEGALIGNLVQELIAGTESRDLYGFVAAHEDQIVGALFFSRLSFEVDIDAFLLAPVAVHSDHQGKGVGQALIAHGLRQLRKKGVRFVATYGDPAFYSKLGFHPLSQDVVEAPFALTQPEGWLGQSLTDEPIEPVPDRCSCVKALNDPRYW